MQEIKITKNEAGQRFDKYLFKYFKEAPASFIYKMLRKKNIELNGKKADGKEKLNSGDNVKIFMSDETIAKFRGLQTEEIVAPIDLDILYEDANVIIVNKPAGMLSQKAEKDDVSINEYILSYLVETGSITKDELKTFKPSVCNRLDRNTSGLIVAGKSLVGLQTMSEMFKERTMDKYYIAIVNGDVKDKTLIKGYLIKDEATNKVTIYNNEKEGSQFIETEYTPLWSNGEITALQVKLITGRTHQIRAHLASVGNSLIGDYKYGNKTKNDTYKAQYGISSQMLHSWKLCFPKMENEFEGLSDKTIKAELPEEFKKVIGNEYLEF